MKVYVVYTTVQYEDAFSIVGVFDVLGDAVTAVVKTYGHEIELDQDPRPGILYSWGHPDRSEDIEIQEFRIGEYPDPCDWC